VSGDKKTVLTEKLLKEREYPDYESAKCLRKGFPLAGVMPRTGVFNLKKEHEIDYGADTQWLDVMAEELREELKEALRKQKLDEIDEKVYKLTNGVCEGGNEVQKGWAEGLYTEEEVSELLGTTKWVSAKRFGVKQGKKVRQIDDYSRFFVNGCTAVEEHVGRDGVDQVANIAKAWIDLIEMAERNYGQFRVEWDDGSRTWHRCHEDFLKEKTQIQGTCIDLEAAYKHCPVDPAHEKYSVFALKNPETSRIEYYFARALPFGAKSSVHGFNRASRALSFLAHEFAGVTVGTYFDDFPLVAPKQVCGDMFRRIIKLMTILGWAMKRKKGSLEWPSGKFECLGVEFEFLADPRILIRNKEGRVPEIRKSYEELKKKRVMSGQELANLRGRMAYSSLQYFGKVGVYPFHVLNKVDACTGPRLMQPQVREAIEWWLESVQDMPPREIQFGKVLPPIRVYSDGACEGKDRQKPAGFYIALFPGQT